MAGRDGEHADHRPVGRGDALLAKRGVRFAGIVGRQLGGGPDLRPQELLLDRLVDHEDRLSFSVVARHDPPHLRHPIPRIQPADRSNPNIGFPRRQQL